MAEAQAPQASEPVHPIQQEAVLLDRFTNFVERSEDNDPHEGTDLEEERKVVPAVEGEDAPAEKTDDAVADDEVEIDEDSPLFEVEVKKTGEKRKVSLREMREGFLAKADYHASIQQVAQEKKDLQEKVRQAHVDATQSYVQQLETYRQAVVKVMAPEILNVDLNRLAQEDPAEAQRIFFKQMQFKETLQGIESARKEALDKINTERQRDLVEAVAKSRETLAGKIPGWNDEKYQAVMKSGVEDYGFAPDEVSKWVDPRVIELLHDASQYRSLKKAKPEIEKRVVAVPKVVKPGSAEKSNPSSDAESELRKKLRKTGDWRDAAELYIARQKRN